MNERESLQNRKLKLITSVWQQLQATSVGQRELRHIQDAIAREFGVDAVESPASLARILADTGAPLRHAEVMDADLKWRRVTLFELFGPDELSFGTLAEARYSFTLIEELRTSLEAEQDLKGLQKLRDLVLGWKKNLQLVIDSPLTTQGKNMSREAVLWFTVWLQDPRLFAIWLDLRQNSPEFRRLELP
jgi:hypothetical protein